MATAKRRGQFRQHEPYATRDLKWYMDWKISRYINYLDSIDPDSIYTLEYDTDTPTKEELLNGIDQHHAQFYSPVRYSHTVNEEEDSLGEDEIFAQAEQLFRQQDQRLKNYRPDNRKLIHREEREKTVEQYKIKEEKEKIRLELLQEEQLKAQTRSFVNSFYKEFKTKGLMDLYRQALDKVATLKFEKLQSDIFDDISTTALEAWEYRLEYITKLIKIERAIKNDTI
jgi:hypothetical protein